MRILSGHSFWKKKNIKQEGPLVVCITVNSSWITLPLSIKVCNSNTMAPMGIYMESRLMAIFKKIKTKQNNECSGVIDVYRM